MAMANEVPLPKWRNFAAWSATGGLVVVVAVILTSWLDGDPLGGLLESATDPRVALALLFSMAVVGMSSRNTRFGWRSFRNFALLSAATGGIAVLAISGLRAGAFGTMGVSEWIAAGAGLVLVFFPAFLSLVMLAARRGWNLVEPDQVELLRERGRLNLLSVTAIAALGLVLIVLALAAPGSVLAPAAALAAVLVLLAAAAALSIACWRQMDELDRTLSYEAGTMAFYLILLLGGGWAALAHLGFVPAAAPLDWLTMLVVVSFPASFIALGRRSLLTTR
jgi:hypothetical protein